MTTMFQRACRLGVAIAACLIVACSPMKEPAEAAYADANAALQKIAVDGEKYAPTEYAAVKSQVADMKAALDKQDYQAVMNAVSRLAPNLKMVIQVAANKKRELLIAARDQWTAMSTDVPKELSAVEAKVAEIGKTHRLPKGVTKDALAGAGSSVEAAKQDWTDATAAKAAGNVEDAVAKATAAVAKLSQVKATLGMDSAKPAAK